MTFNIAILLMCLCCLVRGEYNPYPDISRIHYGYIKNFEYTRIQFNVDIKGYKANLVCTNCLSYNGLNITCKDRILVNVVITLSASNKHYLVPFNVSCIMTNDRDNIANIESTPGIHSLRLSWTISDTSINKYIIYYMTETNYHYETITTNTRSYSLDNLSEKTLYRVCLSPINARSQTEDYKCIMTRTDFSETGPVTDATVSSTENFVSVSWKTPKYEYDMPDGYIVTYRDQNGDCGVTIINMNSSSIIEKESCGNKRWIQWTSLVVLLIPNLRPYTQYTITISPVNKNKAQRMTQLTTTTMEGESGPVSSLTSVIHNDQLLIQYGVPSRPNGVIKGYRVKVVLTRRGICTQTNDVIYDETNIVQDHRYISLNMLTKCSEYRIEVTPINGWSRNGGMGQPYSILFQYKSDNPLIITNVDAKFISSNIVQVSWSHPNIKDECANIGFMVTVSSKDRPSECHVQILSNENCTRLYDIIEAAHVCRDRVLRKYDKEESMWTTNIAGSFTHSSHYHINLWKITDKAILQSQPLLIVGIDNDCSTDCHDTSQYSGIRSAQGCTSWKDSKYAVRLPNSLHSFCTMIDAKYPWCVTRYSWRRCNINKCKDISFISGCVRNIDNSSTSSSITIKWMEPDYRGSIIGYITLLFNTDLECQRSHIQLCDRCQSERSWDQQVRDFYVSCPSNMMETRGVTKMSIFDNLPQNKDYIVYIIPVLSTRDVGEVKRTSVRTMLAKPDAPAIIVIKQRTLSSLQFSWSETTDFTVKGKADMYITTLSLHNKSVQSLTVTTSNVVFTNLNYCTEYCLRLYARNNAGLSDMSAVTCQYTLAPNLSGVSVNDIKSGSYSDITLSWSDYDYNECHRYYKVEIKDKYGKKVIQRSTNSTSLVISEVKPHRIYSVQVRSETKLDTENHRNKSEYSQIKDFYSGTIKPPVYQYRDHIDQSRKKLNISWSFNISQEGSVFEIFVVIRNSSRPCLSLVQLSCPSCPEPYIVANIDDKAQLARKKFLDMCLSIDNNQRFEKDKFSFNIPFIMDEPLKNYSVEIYVINLVGLHNVHGSNSSHIEDQSSKAGVSVIILGIVLVVILFVVLALIMKFKHRPQFLYNMYSKSAKPNGNITKQSNTASKTRLIEQSPIPPNTGSKTQSALAVTARTSNNVPREMLPMLEPKRKGTGIPLKDFPAYYERMVANGNSEIIQEYKKITAECKKLEKQLGLTVDTGKLAANAKKNRFINILPFDQTRVVLQGKSIKNDYINANYIPFLTEESQFEYIASQGPIDQSIDDFWQMIMNENVICVVMLTRTMEDDKFKCLQYWPDNIGEEQTFGHNGEITVVLEKEVELESHIERNLLVKDEVNHIERKIVQLQMHTWSDYSAPNLEHFDKLLFRFHEITNIAENPYLIHCSAGVGRTGTLISIDRIIKQLVNGGLEINIYDTVLTLRHYRNFMVQRQAQYVFIHDYIDHFLKKYMKIDGVEETMYFNEE